MQATVAYIEADNAALAFLVDQNSSHEWVRLYRQREDAALEAVHLNLLTQTNADKLLSCSLDTAQGAETKLLQPKAVLRGWLPLDAVWWH